MRPGSGRLGVLDGLEAERPHFDPHGGADWLNHAGRFCQETPNSTPRACTGATTESSSAAYNQELPLSNQAANLRPGDALRVQEADSAVPQPVRAEHRHRGDLAGARDRGAEAIAGRAGKELRLRVAVLTRRNEPATLLLRSSAGRRVSLVLAPRSMSAMLFSATGSSSATRETHARLRVRAAGRRDSRKGAAGSPTVSAN